MIPYGKQNISEEDIQSVVEVLKSDFLTQGPVVPSFEQTIAEYCDCGYATAVNSATSALHIACLALGLEKGDLLWTSPISFVASANCGIYCGAQVDFVDIDPNTYNMCPNALEAKLKEAKKNKKLPKIVIPVHLTGQSCDMKRIKSLSKEYGFYIIEDASHAIGGRYVGNPIGSCQFSDIAVFSFHPVKIVTTGEGGVATTNSKNLANKMDLYRSHGITRDSEWMTKEPDGPWYYQQILLGYNYRMTELQAVLGLTQMKRVDEFVKKRNELADRYDHLLSDFPLITPYRVKECLSAFHLYVICLPPERGGDFRRFVFNGLRQDGIGVNLHYIPIHTQPYHRAFGFQLGDFPNAEAYYQTAITIPLFYDLSEEDQDKIVETLKNLLI